MYTRLAHYTAALAKLHQPVLLLMPRHRVIAVTGCKWGKQEPQKNLTLTLLTYPESTKYNLDSKISYYMNWAIDNALQGLVTEATRLRGKADALINKESGTAPSIFTKAKRAESLAIYALILQVTNQPQESIEIMSQALNTMNSISSFRAAVFHQFNNVDKLNTLLMIKRGEYKKAEDIFAKNFSAISKSVPESTIAGINYSSLQIIQGKIKSAQKTLNDCLEDCNPVCALMIDVAKHNLQITKKSMLNAHNPSPPTSIQQSFSLP